MQSFRYFLYTFLEHAKGWEAISGNEKACSVAICPLVGFRDFGKDRRKFPWTHSAQLRRFVAVGP
jgi:hypothetical protein